MSAKKKSSKESVDSWISQYMEYVLEEGHHPPNVYKFCKYLNRKEEEFYSQYGSLKALRQSVWAAFFDHTLGLLNKNDDYAAFSNREKLLAFYFSFFEILTLNRSYVLFELGDGKVQDQLSQLKVLRRKFKKYAEALIEDGNDEKHSALSKRSPKVFSEGAWLHFMALIRFWMDDNSAGLEKTDLAIEKSVNTIFDLLDNTALDRVIDLGKFLWKEYSL